MRSLPTILIIMLLALNAQAQFFQGPAATALGGAGRATLDPAEASFMNPATLMQLRTYYGSVHYSVNEHPIDGTEKTWAAQLADGSLDKIMPGSFSVVQKQITYGNGYQLTRNDYMLSLANQVFSAIAFGLSVHRLVDSDNFGQGATQTNLTSGLLFTPTSDFGIALVTYDFLSPDDAVSKSLQLVPTVALGTQYFVQKTLRLRFDFVKPQRLNPDEKLNSQIGLETWFAENFAFRIGWQWREAGFEERIFSSGLGFRGPKLSFDYGYQKDTLVAGAGRHSFDLWMPF